MSDPEIRIIYQIPEGEGFHSPYVGSEPWSEGTVTVDGDMKPIKQTAIPWCITHNQSAERRTDGVWLNECPGDAVECKISTGGPRHKCWEDINEAL